MYHHRKTKIGRDSIGDVLPVLTMIIRPVQAPMVLEKKTFGTSRMHYDLVYTLSELWVFVGHEHCPYPAILRGPCTAAVVGAIHAARGDCHVHALMIRWVEDNGVQGQTSIARHPAVPVRVIE